MSARTTTKYVPNGKTIEIVPTPKCSIKGCDEFATENMCRLGMCEGHYNEAID